jgi:hypothetical protein
VPADMNYRAIRDIRAPVTGALAYTAGQLVHISAVEGPDKWLALGEDVEPASPSAEIAVPARNASQGAWAAFMTTRGLDADEAAGMSRADLIDAWEVIQADPGDPLPLDVPADSGPDGPAAPGSG